MGSRELCSLAHSASISRTLRMRGPGLGAARRRLRGLLLEHCVASGQVWSPAHACERCPLCSEQRLGWELSLGAELALVRAGQCCAQGSCVRRLGHFHQNQLVGISTALGRVGST